METIFNKLAFYDPTNKEMYDRSIKLRKKFEVIMQSIFDTVYFHMMEERFHWTIEDYKEYLNTVKTLLVAAATINFDDLLLRPLFEGGF